MKIRIKKLTKLSWKLALQYALVFFAVLILLNVSVLFGVKLFLINEAMQKVESESGVIEKRIIGVDTEKMALDDPEIIYEAESDNTLDIRIADSYGNIVNASNNFKMSDIPITKNIDTIQKLESEDLHLVVKNIAAMDEGNIKAYIQVTQNMAKEYSFLNILSISLAFADLGGILFSLFAGYLLSRKMLHPIDKMTKAANEIGLSRLSKRLEVPQSDDELSRLANTFNEMLDRIQIAFEQQGQFVANASHELRTPLAIIQGYIGMMDRWGKQDEKVLQESIDAIKKETSSMTVMIEKLLFLARGDNGGQVLQKTNFLIGELMKEVSDETALLSTGHIFKFKGSSELELLADRRMIKQMLRALLDNSIKFTPVGKQINVFYSVNGKNAEFRIVDEGIGIPKKDIQKIFERFYRVDKARARETGGSGLGLSIVKWIVDVHGGQINIESTVEKGTSIIVTLPNSLNI